MAQIFHRSANTISRVTIFGAIFIVGLVFYVIGGIIRSPFFTNQGVEREQPVPFSHQHHVAGLGIDCRYCHTAVETSNFAGIPPTQTCMNCHAQIWTNADMLEPVRASFATGKPLVWSRVHRLPDFVHFNHSIHVAKGIGCATCHGRIDEMAAVTKVASLQMSWCLECHRNPAPNLRPRDQITSMTWQPPADPAEARALGAKLMKSYEINSRVSCTTCHR